VFAFSGPYHKTIKGALTIENLALYLDGVSKLVLNELDLTNLFLFLQVWQNSNSFIPGKATKVVSTQK